MSTAANTPTIEHNPNATGAIDTSSRYGRIFGIRRHAKKQANDSDTKGAA
jgi:hypothetical protein